MGRNQHVVSRGEGWAVEAEGAAKPVAIFKTQNEAWEKAKSIARKERADAVLHAKSGEVRARSAYGYEPRRGKGERL